MKSGLNDHLLSLIRVLETRRPCLGMKVKQLPTAGTREVTPMVLLMVIPVMPLEVSVPQTAELELGEEVELISLAASKFATSPVSAANLY